MIRQLTGKSFAENIEELIISPLELSNTAAEAEKLAVALAKPYTYSRKSGFTLGRYPEHFSSAARRLSCF